MEKTKRWAVIISLVTFSAILGKSVYDYVQFGKIDGAAIFFGFLTLSYFFNALTWGDFEGKKDKNEVEQDIDAQSSKIGYYILMVLSASILFISDGVGNLNEIKNFPLLIVVGLTFLVQPMTAFIYSKRYQ